MRQHSLHRRRGAITLLEVLAVVTVLAIIATTAWVRATSGNTAARKAACLANRGDIEIQSELWRHNTGSWPATNLSDIGADPKYFPSGLPTCPVDGSAYTIDSAGRLVGHNH